jgi:hypothetical protein
MVSAQSARTLDFLRVSPVIADESPDIVVRSYFKWPEKMAGAIFTASAPDTLVRHSFHLQLNCLSYLRGCRVVGDVMPLALRDEASVEQNARSRLQSADPCPERILAHRVRDSAAVLLAEIQRAESDAGADNEVVRGSYHVLQTLKGKAGFPELLILRTLRIPPDANELVPNPAVNLLHPKQRVLIFIAQRPDAQDPCQMVKRLLAQSRSLRRQ